MEITNSTNTMDFEDIKALHYLALYRRGEIKLHPVEVKQFEAIEKLYK